MNAPTPDEAVRILSEQPGAMVPGTARYKALETVVATLDALRRDLAAAREREQADSTLRGALWQVATTSDDLLTVLAERDALRAEVERAQGLLKSWEAHAQEDQEWRNQTRAALERARAREQAARPVLDAAEAWDAAWVMGTAGVREGTALHNALARYESTPLAALGSAEAGAACTAAAFDGSSCRGTVVDGQCSEQDDHHPTAGMLPYDGPGAEAGAPAAEPAPDGWCCWPCARLARAAEPASDVQAARVRVAADMVRKALAYRLGVTGLCRLDTAADIGWLVETGRQIVTALDAAGAGAPEPAQDDEEQS